MHRFLLATALVAAASSSALAQATSVQPSKAARVEVKVDQSVANTATVNGDSAFALARAHANNGEVSSAELETKDGRLVYEVKVLDKHKGAHTVWIDARSGAVLEATRHGGLKAAAIHHKENKKLLDAKRDSAAKNP